MEREEAPSQSGGDAQRRLEGLCEVLEVLTRAANLGELHEGLVELIVSSVFGARHAMVLEGDQDSELLFAVASSEESLRGVSVPRTERLERVLKGQIVALKDASSSPEWEELTGALSGPVRAALYLPVRTTTALVGVHPERGFFSREHVLMAGRLVPALSQLFHRIVSQQHQLQRLRAQHEHRLVREQFVLIKDAARALGAGVAVLGSEGALVEASDAFRELIDAWASPERWWESARRVLSETPMRGADALELARDEQARERARRQARRTVDLRDPDGHRRVFELNFTGHAHQLAEGDFGHVMLVAEITRWVLAEEALVSARDEAQRANRAKSQFLANMSHELRTPLNAIIGYSEMLIEDLEASQAAADFSGDVERIHTSAHQLLRLINDVLDLSKIEAGKLELHYDEIDLEALLDEVEQTVHPMIQRGNNRLVSQREGLPGQLTTDRDKLRQVLLNLLSNAAKFTESGQVTLEARAEGERLVFEVRDTGIGISEADQARLFDAFEQIDGSSTRRHGGTGLGLTISRRFCQMMGGDITVDSKLESGSTFRVVLPRTPPEPSPST